jgi:hypothetical protein
MGIEVDPFPGVGLGAVDPGLLVVAVLAAENDEAIVLRIVGDAVAVARLGRALPLETLQRVRPGVVGEEAVRSLRRRSVRRT